MGTQHVITEQVKNDRTEAKRELRTNSEQTENLLTDYQRLRIDSGTPRLARLSADGGLLAAGPLIGCAVMK